MLALKIIKLMYQIKSERSPYLSIYIENELINFYDIGNLKLDLRKSSAEIRDAKVTIKFSIIKDSSPFKMAKKNTWQRAALELKLSWTENCTHPWFAVAEVL